MNLEPLVSIITPAFNASLYIGETIESVLNQKYSNWELLIVDDCSNDNTVEIVHAFSLRDSRVKLLRLTSNSGHPSIPRNEAIKFSKLSLVANAKAAPTMLSPVNRLLMSWLNEKRRISKMPMITKIALKKSLKKIDFLKSK